jgi:hypothetical protein
MIDHVNALKTSWYISPPWGRTIPPVAVNLLERVFLRTTRTFGYCSGVQWKHECWLYTVICGIKRIHDPRFGQVGLYPESVLVEVFKAEQN